MKSTHDNATASEYLRLALPYLARHGVPATPPNYAVWYEYVCGENAALRKAIDAMTAEGQPIGEEATGDLYHRYVADWDAARFDEARRALVGLVAQIDGSIEDTGSEVERYQDALAVQSQRLTSSLSAQELGAVVETLSLETGTVRAAGRNLTEQLEDSRREIENLRDELEQAKEEALTDPLTGLANRKALDRALAALTQTGGEESAGHALLIADIDHFKRVNDSFGHVLGDKVIKFVAHLMMQSVKGRDLVARYGGEEFAILLPDTTLDGAVAAAENMRGSIEAGTLVRTGSNEHIGVVTISVGVACYEDGEPCEAFIERADEALLRAKRSGRNKVLTEARTSAAHQLAAAGP